MGKLLILLFGIYTCTVAIFYYMPPRLLTIEQAAVKVFKWYGDIAATFFKALARELIGWRNTPPDYPVHIGYDGIYIRTDIADKEFAELSKCFLSFYCEKYNISENTIQYLCKVQINTENDEPQQNKALVQNYAEKALKHHLQENGCDHPAEPLTATQLLTDSLIITFAKNPKGIEEIRYIKERLRLLAREAKTDRQVMREKWNDMQEKSQSRKSVWGYRCDIYHDTGVTVSIQLETASYCHALITGSSGSGKSQALLFLIGKMVQANPDTRIYICDYKNSDDFQFLKPYAHYYAGNDCYKGVMDYHEHFSSIRENGTDRRRHLLIFDEYPSFINYLQMKDKLNKTKLASDILSAVSEILMLGRGTGGGFGCWIVTQRSDSSLFANGARDNFMVVIGLGNLSKEQRSMTFSSMDIPERIFTAGEGILLADGKELTEVKYPLIEDVSDWQEHIMSALMRHDSACADV